MSSRQWVKVCGFTCREEVAAAAELGIDAVGVVLAESKRQVTSAQAAEILAAAPAHIARVGVFVNAALPEILSAAETAGLDIVQLHGGETPEFAAKCAGSGLKVIKALRVQNRQVLAQLTQYKECGLFAFLLDSYVPGLMGGSGASFDWSIARAAGTSGAATPVILAGGLTPENVCAAITAAAPWGIDVSSGVEVAPGKKDLTKIARLMSTLGRCDEINAI